MIKLTGWVIKKLGHFNKVTMREGKKRKGCRNTSQKLCVPTINDQTNTITVQNDQPH